MMMNLQNQITVKQRQWARGTFLGPVSGSAHPFLEANLNSNPAICSKKPRRALHGFFWHPRWCFRIPPTVHSTECEASGERIVIWNSTHANSIFEVGHNSESSIRQESEIGEWASRTLEKDKEHFQLAFYFYVNKELSSMSRIHIAVSWNFTTLESCSPFSLNGEHIT